MTRFVALCFSLLLIGCAGRADEIRAEVTEEIRASNDVFARTARDANCAITLGAAGRMCPTDRAYIEAVSQSCGVQITCPPLE